MGVGRRRGNSTKYTAKKLRPIIPYRENVQWKERQVAGLESDEPRGKVTLPEPGDQTYPHCLKCGSVLPKQSAQQPQTGLPGENMRKP